MDNLESEVDPDVEEAWRTEIARRVAELDSGTAETVPWETVQAELLRLRNEAPDNSSLSEPFSSLASFRQRLYPAFSVLQTCRKWHHRLVGCLSDAVCSVRNSNLNLQSLSVNSRILLEIARVMEVLSEIQQAICVGAGTLLPVLV